MFLNVYPRTMHGSPCLLSYTFKKHSRSNTWLFIVHLSFFMCRIFLSTIEQLSVLYTEGDVPWFQKIIGWHLTRFFVLEKQRFYDIFSDSPMYPESLAQPRHGASVLLTYLRKRLATCFVVEEVVGYFSCSLFLGPFLGKFFFDRALSLQMAPIRVWTSCLH